MNFIVDFYKNLDTVNLFIFWGVIAVVTLLLIFAIIISNKNKKLERIIKLKGIDIDDLKDMDIPTLKEEIIHPINESEKTINTNETKEINDDNIKNDTVSFFNTASDNNTVSNENKVEKSKEDIFVAEEHVIDYNNKQTDMQNTKNDIRNEIDTPTKPYQRNILKEMSFNQTSPIGIIKKEEDKNIEIRNAEELNGTLNETKDYAIENKELVNVNSNDKKISSDNQIYNNYKKGNYLEELSKNTSKIKEEIDRTDYELQQEEDAIISYEELMKKKDNIKMIDEEEAIISINELLERKNKHEKLYNLNNIEEDKEFIDELKNFRSDL